MSKEELASLREVIDYLDDQMKDAPNRALADASNKLEAIYQAHKGDK